MKRYLEPHIRDDLQQKIVIITGPRQVGKTTLAKALYPNVDYLNYDAEEDRLLLKAKQWDRQKTLIVFDELHKKRDWKRWLKGVYDTEGIPPQLLVTGSAQLDTYRKVGDSLAGRYFQFRLHPLDLWEATHHFKLDEQTAFEQLWRCGGYPEPFFKGNETFYRRWQRSHLDIILKQDLIDLYSVRDIKSIETLITLLKNRVGASVSYASLARDLERDINTIKRWIQLLENLYIIFRVTPYHKNVARSLLKEPKFYFYDHCQTSHDPGAHFENIIASALLKQLHYIEDTTGKNTALHYLRTKDGKEIDFLITIDEKPTHMIEAKLSDDTPSKHFEHFRQHAKFEKDTTMLQLVKTPHREKTTNSGVEVRDAIAWLSHNITNIG
jgi:uncharacterized protein